MLVPTTSWLRTTFLVALLLLPALVQANGLPIHLAGHRQLGMGYTGTGFAADAASMYFNPGSLSFVSKRSIQFGVGIYVPRTSYLAETPNIYTSDMDASLLYTPAFFYVSWHLRGSRFSVGLGANSPFWYETKWPDDWKGRFITQESSLTTLFIQPTLSYRINEQLSLGAGLVYGFGNSYVRRALPINASGQNDAEGSMELNGNGQGLGISVGLYFQPNDTFSMGFTYRSRITMAVEQGEAKFVVPPSLEDLYPQTLYRSELRFPRMWSLGISYLLKEDFRIAFDVNLAEWQLMDTVFVDYGENTLRLQDEALEKNFQNSLGFRLGGEYIAHERMRVRGGLWYEVSPVQENYVSPELPDANRIGLTAGAGFVLFRQFSIDVAYQYIFTGERTAYFKEAAFGGTYQSSISTVALGLTYAY